MTTATKAKKGDREVIYTDDNPAREIITVEKAKELLGWEKVPQNGIPEIETKTGERVVLKNNIRNRPIRWSHVEELAQEILNGEWRYNGAGISIGKTGLVMSAQHRLLGLIFAEWERNLGPNAERWQEIHAEPLSIDTVITYGLEEDDHTFSTLNREMSASFADTLFRGDWFPQKTPSGAKITSGMRKLLARLTDHAVKFLWLRTGAKHDPFAPRRTPTEALRFLPNHRKLMECVYHVALLDNPVKKEGEKREHPIGDYIPAGFMAALMYLMATSESDGAAYRDVGSVSERSEKKLKFTRMDKAKEFVSEFATGNLETVRRTIISLADKVDSKTLPPPIVASVLVKAWKMFVEGKNPTAGKLDPFVDTDKGPKAVDENIGGIDTAGMKKSEILGKEEVVTTDVLTPEQKEKEETQADKHRKRKEARAKAKVAEAEKNGSAESEGEAGVPDEEESGEPAEAGYEE